LRLKAALCLRFVAMTGDEFDSCMVSTSAGLSAHHQWSATAAILGATSNFSKNGIRRTITELAKRAAFVLAPSLRTGNGFRYEQAR
jgi:hypothetical protein